MTVTHSGAELGQGINTKVAQTVASSLGIDLSLIRIAASSTANVTNGGLTGGSGTSEVVCQAAINACSTLNNRLAPFKSQAAAAAAASGSAKFAPQMDTSSWIQLLTSLPPETSLNVEGWYSPSTNPNEQPFQYFVYAAALSEIELDVLSGEVNVLSSEIVYDCGQSLNPAVDIGGS